MKNKLGVADYGMDVWYGGCWNLEERLELLKGLGLDGIEWVKGATEADLIRNAALFRSMGMDFASCSMSTPEMTMRCAAALGREYIWITVPCTRNIPFDDYCRRCNAFVDAAKRYNLKAALHNHLGTCIENQDELDKFMEVVPGAALLLDIAHLHAAGGDCVKTVQKYHDRLAAVHFKDIFYKDLNVGLDVWWDRLRFCELGGGNAGLDYEAIAKELQKYNYDKWVLIEHDTHLRAPELDLKVSADILRGLFA